jgi:hypothetical protein
MVIGAMVWQSEVEEKSKAEDGLTKAEKRKMPSCVLVT